LRSILRGIIEREPMPKARWGFVQVTLCLRHVRLGQLSSNSDSRIPRRRLYVGPANFIPKIAPDISAFLVLWVVVSKSNMGDEIDDRQASDQSSN
jgi:hypothetical protein